MLDIFSRTNGQAKGCSIFLAVCTLWLVLPHPVTWLGLLRHPRATMAFWVGKLPSQGLSTNEVRSPMILLARWWFPNFFLFTPKNWGKWSNLTDFCIFFRWVGEEPPSMLGIFKNHLEVGVPRRDFGALLPSATFKLDRQRNATTRYAIS